MSPADRMRAFRESIGWNRAELARSLGCHPSYVAHLEEGKRQLTGLEYAQRLEALSKDWEHGPIRVEEWLLKPLPEPAEPKPSDSDPTEPNGHGAAPASHGA